MDAPSRPCQVKARLRPLGRPALSTLLGCAERLTRHASRLSYKYLIRTAMFLLFAVNIALYIVHIISHEIICTALFIFYHQGYLRTDYDDLDSEKLQLPATEPPLDADAPRMLRKRRSTRLLGVDFAPADVPLPRRLQTVCAALCSFSFFFAGSFFTALSVYLLFTKLNLMVLLYLIWYFYDYSAHEQGGRRIHWYRRWRLWTRVAEYFPIELIKTTDLSPDRNYVFGYHPHGIMAAGSFVNFGTEGTGFSSLFPGIAPHLMTLTINFRFPFYRDLLLGLGLVSVTKKSLNWILQQKGVGQAAIIVVGGAQEALDAHRNSNVALTLTSRKGFVKAALQNGADLVPVFSFGENDVYEQAANPPGSKLRLFQERLKRVLGFSPPLFHGRGLLQYTWGYVPYRAKITTVVGAPLHVDKVDEPTPDCVDQLHARYVQALQQLFETHKYAAGCGQQTLTIY